MLAFGTDIMTKINGNLSEDSSTFLATFILSQFRMNRIWAMALSSEIRKLLFASLSQRYCKYYILSSCRESEKPVNSIQGATLKKMAYLFLTKFLICHGFSYKNHGWYLYYFSDLARTTIFLKNTFQHIWKMHVLEFFLEIFADPSFKFKCPHLDNIQSSDLCSSSILLFIFFQFDITLGNFMLSNFT